ncbi:MAG: UTP--glucose-1-phosphate uridylyltransferase GalU [SAR202 cluster bacterium]|nr:UTP--glucose-1-phosphate uridylyltransferase GalU [SAR202 cluster bacterium]|tara:strand:- start:6184 stop:7059 length:876 start_codon:yes stop_codon:yes gene_type:complete
MDVHKAVIPAAGLGTRLLPVSKAVPKELLPLVDRPMLHYIVEEALDAGITQIVIVTSQGKDALADYFDPAPYLEKVLEERGEGATAAAMRRVRTEAEFIFVRQHEQLGLGHAVYTARHAVGDEPFAVMLPDDIIDAPTPALGQLLATAQQYNASVVAVEEVPPERISGYGVIEPEDVADGVYRVLSMVEKPTQYNAPSNLGIVGRYILTPEVFSALNHVTPGAKGELQLTDGIALLMETQAVYARRFEGIRHDAGNPLGLIKASVSLALKRPDLGPALRKWLQETLAQEQG